MQLFVATANRGKQAELKSLLSDLPLQLVFPQDISTPVTFPEETGSTFAENALLKAKSLAQQTGLPSLADDSGLSVVSLGNFPGVISARWQEGSDSDRCTALLKKLGSNSDRSAFFSCVICLYLPDTDTELFFEGHLKGSIATAAAGTEGFGYDPIFIPEGENRTLAEVGTDTKNKISHRAKALDKCRVFIQNNYAKLDDRKYDTHN